MNAERFRRHWTICPDAEIYHVNGFIKKPLGKDFTLHYHSDLHVSSRTYAGGIVIILGAFVHYDYNASMELDGLASTRHEDVVDWLNGCAGAYALISVCENIVKLYTDMAGIFSVYRKENYLASSPYLIPGIIKSKKVESEYSLSGSDDWYPGDLTPFEGCTAIYGNHCLNLSEQSIKRFWPIPDDVQKKISREAAISKISIIHQRNIESFSKKYSCAISLTGGKDSRLNLAAARNVLDSVYFFTIRSNDQQTYDIQAPVKMAREFGFTHNIIDSYQPTISILNIYDEAAGDMSIGARRDILDACEKVASRADVHLSGALGEYLKCQYWPSSTPHEISGKILQSEFIQHSSLIKNSITDWVESLPENMPPTMAYDLMYIEQRGGRWAGNGETASAIFFAPGTPLNCRKIFDVFQSMPRKLERNGTVQVELIKKLWPELLSVPFEKSHRGIAVLLPKALRLKIKKLKNSLFSLISK